MKESINNAKWVIPWLDTSSSWNDEIKDRVYLIITDCLWGIVEHTKAMNQDYYLQNKKKIHSLFPTK